MKKLTNSDIDRYLIDSDRNIKRLGEYKNNTTPIEFECLICQFSWNSMPSYIKNSGGGCPNCADRSFVSNDLIDRYLLDNKIQVRRKSNITHSKQPVELECLICNYKWVRKGVSRSKNCFRCANCANVLPPSDQAIDKYFVDNNINIERIESYINAITKINFKCLDCNHIWKAHIRRLKQGHGCPKCAGNAKLSNDYIDNYLLTNDKKITRVGDYINARKPIEFLCSVCKFNWHASPYAIKLQGCPKCSTHKNQKLVGKFLDDYGIMYVPEARIFPDHNRWRVDFYLKISNIIIEYNGDQHYRPVRFGNMSEEEMHKQFKLQQDKDAYRRKFAADNGYLLIEIDGRKYKDVILKQYLINEILPIIKKCQT